jgi:hypothetical protein
VIATANTEIATAEAAARDRRRLVAMAATSGRAAAPKAGGA